MDSSNSPLAVLLIIAVSATTFYLFAPRMFRFFCIGAGLSWWQSAPTASLKTTFQACAADHHRGSQFQEYECMGNVGLLALQTVVYTIVVMCGMKELEYILRRREGRQVK